MTTRLNFGVGGSQTVIINDDACLAENEWQVTVVYCDFVIYMPKAEVRRNSFLGTAICAYQEGSTSREYLDLCKVLSEQGYTAVAKQLKEDIIPYLRKEV